jgi:hypothetical protein
LSERHAKTVADELELITPGLGQQRGDDTRPVGAIESAPKGHSLIVG